MNRKFLLFTGAAALLVAFFALGPTPNASADPFSLNWDVVMTDTGAPAGDGDGTIEAGENPDVVSRLVLDISNPAVGAVHDENIFGLANSWWNGGLTPASGAALTDGDRVGSITFSIHSGLINPLTSNVSGITGQPPKCGDAGSSVLSNTLDIYDAELATSPTVSIRDTDADGLAQEFEDNMLADGSAGSNGVMDGADVMPDALASTVLPNLGFGSPLSRAFGLAQVSVSLSVESTVNFLVYDLTADPDIDAYLSVTVLNYPGLPGQQPGPTAITAQTVVTCPPFSSSVTIYGRSHGNPSAVPAITGNIPLRTAVAGGPFDYGFDASSADNYDGDAAAQDFDTCETVVSVNTDLGGGADPDSDRWDSACDPAPASFDNNGAGGAVTPDYNAPALNTWPVDPDDPCAYAGYVPPLAGAWDCDQDVDGDGTLNTVDNCPFTRDADVDDADADSNLDTGVDWQLDTDTDGVGDVCDPAPTIRGDGNGYAAPAPGTYQDKDDFCNDTFSIPGTEPLDGGFNAPNGFCVSSGADGVYGSGPEGRHWNDSNDDGDPDWDDVDSSGTYLIGEPIDTNDDSDADNHTDACEAVKGSDALSVGSQPAPTPVPGDCDSDTMPDATEEASIRNPFTPGPGETATPTLTPTPAGPTATPTATATASACTDREGDTSCDDPAGDPDDDGCTTGEEATLGAAFDPTAAGWFDVYDVRVPANVDPTANGSRNKVVDIGDVLAVLFYAFAEDNQAPNANGVDYDSLKGITPPHDSYLENGIFFDRSPGAGPDGVTGIDPAGAPNGVVDIGDVLATLAQAFVVDCSG